MLEALIKAVCEKYRKDPSAPSVVSSWLAAERVWYASIVRYRSKYGEDKLVVCHAKDANLEATYRLLCFEFLKEIDQGPALTELRAMAYPPESKSFLSSIIG